MQGNSFHYEGKIMKKSKSIKYAESRSRTYTINELKNLGWDVRHPSKGGNVLEEQEAKHFDPRFDELLGKDRPDFLLFWKNNPVIVIENKGDKKNIDTSITEAKEYAEKLSKKYFDVRVISGVAGNDESGVIVRNYYRNGTGQWEEIKGNGYPLTQLLSISQLEQVLVNKCATIDLKIPTEQEFYDIAERINQILHDAHVNKSDRAVYLGAILLALKEGNIDTSPNVIIQQVNGNVNAALDSCGKSELKPIVRIRGGSPKLRRKLPLIFHNLDRLNIRALMNTGADVLGKFFETFLRYGNDAKELGIVFTPRHVISLMCELVEVNSTDIVYDPACGTGGFLIGAFNRMKEQVANSKEALENIKLHQLIGCDSDDSGKIPALAVVNMIFRGDGKSNIYNENCFTFDKFGKSHFVTKVLMNPPFAQSDEPETMFIEHGLNSLKEGNLLATIAPYSIMSQKTLANWRKNLLKNHTLVAAITMPYDLFYPTSSSVCILVLRAHIPHSGKVWFCRIDNDGFKIKRKKRIECEGEQLSRARNMFKARGLNIGVEEDPSFACYLEPDPDDELSEFSPEAYLTSSPTPEHIIQENVEQLVRDFGAFTLKYEPKLEKIRAQRNIMYVGRKQYGKKKLSDIFNIDYGQGEIHSKGHLKPGGNLVISSQGGDNGCYGFFDIEIKYKEPVISVPNTGSIGMAFVQEYPCCIDDNCLVLSPKDKVEISIEEMYFVATSVRLDSWRYRYGRQITDKRLAGLEIDFSKFNYNKTKALKERIESIF